MKICDLRSAVTTRWLALLAGWVLAVPLARSASAPADSPAFPLDTRLTEITASATYSSGSGIYGDTATITITSNLANGAIFYSTDGTTPSIGGPLTYTAPFTLSATKTIRALAVNLDTFETKAGEPLTVTIVPTYALALTTAGGGTVVATPTASRYLSGTVVSITATPATGWTWMNWTGEVSGAATTSVTMSGPRTAAAVFGTTLTSSVTGGGAVAVSPAASTYAYGSVVQLVPKPNEGSAFSLWGGASSGSANPLDFTVTQPGKTISALFSTLSAGQVNVYASVVGDGTVSVSPQKNVYATGESVTLTAVPGAQQVFTGWSGGGTSTANPLVVALAASQSVTANFLAGVAPVITTAPVSQAVSAGTSVTFTVVATGTPAPTYQWRKDGSNISAATNATYTIAAAAAVDAGSYDVVLSNPAGSNASAVVTLSVTGLLAEGLIYSLNGSTATITGYSGPLGAVTIPPVVGGLPVSAIGDGAFAGNTSITSLVLPNYLRKVGASAFAGCTSLGLVSLAPGLAEIGEYAFSNCNLATIVIPASVVSLGQGPFHSNPRLLSINVESGSTNYSSVDGVLYDKPQRSLIQVPGGFSGQLVLPSTVQNIFASSLYNCKTINNIVLPQGLTSIGHKAFLGCTVLEDLMLPTSLLSIGSYAFQSCPGFKSMSIPRQVSSIGAGFLIGCHGIPQITVDELNPNYSADQTGLYNKQKTILMQVVSGMRGEYVVPVGVTSIAISAFQNCQYITRVSIPDGVATVPRNAFLNCYLLTEVGLPSSVQTIDKQAFYGCRSLVRLTVPARVQALGDSVFSGCSALEAITFLGNAPTLGSGEVPANVRAIFYEPANTGWGPTFGGVQTLVIGTPFITTQPQAVSVATGASATLSVTATGSPAPTYQWRKDGTAISGATNASYAIGAAVAGDAGAYTVTATNSLGSATSSAATLEVNRLNQTITFGALAAKTSGDAPFALGATASSGLSVTYASSNPAVATVIGNTVTIVGAGSATITASQAGNANYSAATAVTQTLTVNATAPVLPTLTWTTATVAGNMRDITFNQDTGVAVGDGGRILRSTDAGLSWIAVDSVVTDNLVAVKYAGGSTFYACGWIWGSHGVVLKSGDNGATWSVVLSLNAGWSEQFGLFCPDVNTVYVSGTNSIRKSINGGLTFSLTTFPNGYEYRIVPVKSSLVALANGGSVVLRTSTDGGSTWVTSSTQPDYLVNWRDLVVHNDAAYVLGDSGGLFKSADGIAFTNLSVAGGPSLISGCSFSGSLFACDAGNLFFINSAGSIQKIRTFDTTVNGTGSNSARLFVVGSNLIASAMVSGAASQSIAWAGTELSGKKYGDGNIALNATTTASGLSVGFTSDNPVVATVSGSTLTITGAGTANITASQAGDASFAAATAVVRTLTVAKATATVTLGNLAATYDGSAKAASAPTTPAGLAVNLTYDGSVTAPTNAGSYAVVGTISNANYAGSASGTLVIAKANQTITFGALTAKTNGDAPSTLGATASSGLAVSYASSNTAVATVSGSTVTIVGAGTTTITASQAGDGNYSAAPPVPQPLVVTSPIFAPVVALTSETTNAYVTTGGTGTYRVRITYTGQTPSGMGVSLSLPSGWTFVSYSGPSPMTQPSVGDNVLEWAYSNFPSNELTFTLTVNYPTGQSGTKSVLGAVNYRPGPVTVAFANLNLTAVVPPSITTQPVSRLAGVGTGSTFTVVASGTAPLSYQWKKNGSALADGGNISGAATATLSLSSLTVGDAANYTAVVTNAGGTETSNAATLTVIDALLTHAVVGAGYIAGGTVTLTQTLTYTGSCSGLGWQMLLPAGWSYASSGGSAGDVRPSLGATSLLEWAWTNVPVSPVTFTATLNVPAGETGDRNLTSLSVFRVSAGAANLLVRPDPLVVSPITTHSSDTNVDFRLSLFELTRVIELYNTRNGTVRTGRYAVATTATEDGFAPDPVTAPTATVTPARYHSGDSSRDGKLSLIELTRVIELYNTRSGTVRTGAYHPEAGTEDGFAPGP